jgi:4-hydroxy-tetrahydrodipicolinate synthase
MDQFQFKGTGVAIVTPFREDKSIDFNALEKVVNHLIGNKVEYLVVLGTTGENVTLGKEEKRAIIDHVISINAKRVPLMVGFGGNYTAEVVKSIQENSFTGISGILSVGPYYNKPIQAGFYEHFREISAASPVPVTIYNVPGRTGSNMSAETMLRLAHDFKNIVAVKEASGNLEQIMQVLRDKPAGFHVISGDDLLTVPIIAMGGSGVISVSANAFPYEVSEMVRLALAGQYNEANKLHYKMMDITRALFTEGSPAGVKAVLHSMNICGNNLRLPLVPVSKAHYAKLAEMTKKIKG